MVWGGGEGYWEERGEGYVMVVRQRGKGKAF